MRVVHMRWRRFLFLVPLLDLTFPLQCPAAVALPLVLLKLQAMAPLGETEQMKTEAVLARAEDKAPTRAGMSSQLPKRQHARQSGKKMSCERGTKRSRRLPPRRRSPFTLCFSPTALESGLPLTLSWSSASSPPTRCGSSCFCIQSERLVFWRRMKWPWYADRD